MTTNDIVVGFDGSAGSERALRWAANEARVRDVPLRVVLAYEWVSPAVDFAFGGPPVDADVQYRAQGMAAGAAQLARDGAPGVEVTATAVRGPAIPTLFAAAQDAALLVVGSRGHGGFVNLLLGSVSQQLATHATVPVVVVRDGATAHDGPVVVGVDLSDATDHTLALAFEAAAAAGSDLVVINAYEPPNPPWGIAAVPLIVDTPSYRAAVRPRLTAAVAPWQEKYPTVAVETLIAQGHAAQVLAEVSVKARLVVVGTRGHGGFAGLLLGSVGQALLHHAESPVLIAR